MKPRRYTAADGQVWTFRIRPQVRQGEAGTHVVLLIESPFETRVVTCERSEWESTTPDLAGLLARSVPSGASRGQGAPPQEPPPPPRPKPPDGGGPTEW